MLKNALKILILIFVFVIFFSSTSFVNAHVVVSPREVSVGQRLNFVVGVPTEKEIPTSSVRLVIPEGVESVRPLVKSGWRVEIIKNEADLVTEIIWSGGSIPVDQKDEFVISAKAPASETELNWKAYQTYSDGSVVSWDLAPNVEEVEGSGPYSTTKVVNDLEETSAVIPTNNSSNGLATVLSIAALGLASYACFFRKKG